MTEPGSNTPAQFPLEQSGIVALVAIAMPENRESKARSGFPMFSVRLFTMFAKNALTALPASSNDFPAVPSALARKLLEIGEATEFLLAEDKLRFPSWE